MIRYGVAVSTRVYALSQASGYRGGLMQRYRPLCRTHIGLRVRTSKHHVVQAAASGPLSMDEMLRLEAQVFTGWHSRSD